MRLSPIRLDSDHRFFECERCGKAFTTRHIRSVLYGEDAITPSGAKAGLRWNRTSVCHYCQPRDLLSTVLFEHANFAIGWKRGEWPRRLHIYALKADGSWEEMSAPSTSWQLLIEAIFADKVRKIRAR